MSTTGIESLLEKGCEVTRNNTVLYCSSRKLSQLPDLPDTFIELTVHNTKLKTLPALPPSLERLECYKNRLTQLPELLPNTLKQLNCSNNKLKELPNIPNVLTDLNCSHNNLTELPDLPTLLKLNCAYNDLIKLPNLHVLNLYCNNNTRLTNISGLLYGIQVLNCSNIPLTQLPELPDSIRELYCNHNGLNELPDLLPSRLGYLSCSHNNLTSLPELRNEYNGMQFLEILHCNNNHITELPHLPNNIQVLNCSRNKLTNLPNLSQSIKVLNCSHNKLTELPDLPNTLTELNCSYNNLTKLPDLPNTLTELNCSNNYITDLPHLPALGISNITINCSNNPLDRLPNLNIHGEPFDNSLIISVSQLDLFRSIPEEYYPDIQNSSERITNYLSNLTIIGIQDDADQNYSNRSDMEMIKKDNERYAILQEIKDNDRFELNGEDDILPKKFLDKMISRTNMNSLNKSREFGPTVITMNEDNEPTTKRVNLPDGVKARLERYLGGKQTKKMKRKRKPRKTIRRTKK